MKKEHLLIKIMITLFQATIIPCCIIGDWADKYWGSYGVEFSNLNFLDASVLFDTEYIATVFVIIFAVSVVVMIWTKFGKYAFVPAFLQLIIAVVTVVDFIRLSISDEGHMKAFGYVHTGMIAAAFVLCVVLTIKRKERN